MAAVSPSPKSVAKPTKKRGELSGVWAASRDRSAVREGKRRPALAAWPSAALEEAASDWLQNKTIANVDPQLPEGGWFASEPGSAPRSADGSEMLPKLRASRGNLVNGAGKIVWAARPDLPLTVNSQLAAAFLEWVDEFQLSEEDVPGLARSVLGRLLVLQAGPSGLPPASQARIVACEAGIKWLHEARDDARPLYRRTGWVNVPHIVRLSAEVAARGAAAEAGAQFAGEKPLIPSNRSSSFGNGLIALASAVSVQDRPARCSPRPLTKQPPSRHSGGGPTASSCPSIRRIRSA